MTNEDITYAIAACDDPPTPNGSAYRHQIKPGCGCLACMSARGAAKPAAPRYGDGALVEYVPLAAREIPVTHEMVAAAVAYDPPDGEVEDAEYFAAIFRAMATARGAIQLSSDQTTWFNNVVRMLPEKDREIAELRAKNQQWQNSFAEVEWKRQELASLHTDAARLSEEIRMLHDDITFLHAEIANRLTASEVNALLAAKDARIAELDTELALLRRAACDDPSPTKGTSPQPAVPDPVAVIQDTQSKPPKEHNPFRTFPTDPRRMGP